MPSVITRISPRPRPTCERRGPPGAWPGSINSRLQTFSGGYTHNLYAEQQLPGVDQRDREFDTADAGFDALWELDFFGRVRRNVEASRADVGAAAATLQDARV